MPTKLRTSRVQHTTLEHEHEGGTLRFELSSCPNCDEDEIRVRRTPDGGWAVGYLVQDSDVPDPLKECDGMGRIHTSHRHAGHEDHEAFRKARGLDEHWRHTRKPNPWAVSLDCYDHGGQCWAVSGSLRARMFPDQYWDVGHGVGVWVPNECCEEEIRYRALKSFLPEGVTIGYKSQEPYGQDGKGYLNRILLTINVGTALAAVQNWQSRQRGTELPTEISLNPRGYKSFVTAARSALRFFGIKPTKADVQARQRAAAVEMAESAVETYNQWLSGDVWGHIVDRFTAEGEPLEERSDSCWGHFGTKWAWQCCDEAMDDCCGKEVADG